MATPLSDYSRVYRGGSKTLQYSIYSELAPCSFQSRTKWIWVEIVVKWTGDGFLQLTIPTSFLSLQKKYYTRRRRQREKSSRFRLARQQLSTCIMLFCTFVSRHCKTTTWKCLISRFVGDVNARERLCSFSELRYSLRWHCTGRFSTGWKIWPDFLFNTFALFTRNCRIVMLQAKWVIGNTTPTSMFVIFLSFSSWAATPFAVQKFSRSRCFTPCRSNFRPYRLKIWPRF